jgi:hypothetical protein
MLNHDGVLPHLLAGHVTVEGVQIAATDRGQLQTPITTGRYWQDRALRLNTDRGSYARFGEHAAPGCGKNQWRGSIALARHQG